MAANAATIQISQPKRFGLGAALTVNAYGLLLMAPVFVSMLVASILPLGILTALLPLLVVAAAAYFLPFGMGNTHITRLVRSFAASAASGRDGFVVQLTLTPKLRSGLRATLEDADDIGWLTLGPDALAFAGDSVQLCVPYQRIERVQPRNIGLRGAFVYGRRIKLAVAGLPEAPSMELAERSSWLLPASRRITAQLYTQLLAKVPPAKAVPAAATR